MCVYVSIYLSIYLSIYESIYAYMLRMYVCIYAWTCVRIYGCMYVRMYVCMHLYVCMCVYMYVCMHVSPHAVRSGVRAPAAHRCSAALDTVLHHLVEAGSPSMQAHLEATAQPSARSCVHIAVICDQTVFNHLFFKKKNNNENFKIEYSRNNFQCET